MKPMFVLGLAACILAGCSSTRLPDGSVVVTPNTASSIVPQVDMTHVLPAVIPYAGTLVPDTTIKLLPGFSVTLEKLVYWGGTVAAAYLITDPLAPNWSVEEAQFPKEHFHLSLHMKRYYAGGAGEARVIFHRRAKELMHALGYSAYQVVEYTEGMESSVLGAQRTAQGVIRLQKAEG